MLHPVYTLGIASAVEDPACPRGIMAREVSFALTIGDIERFCHISMPGLNTAGMIGWL
jgi:hypothetical protein